MHLNNSIGRMHSAWYHSYGSVPLRFGGNIVRRIGTQQQLNNLMRWDCFGRKITGLITEEIRYLEGVSLRQWHQNIYLKVKQYTFTGSNCTVFFIIIYLKRSPFTLYWSKRAILFAYCSESGAYCTELRSHVH